jgi:hypothetical protein
LWLLGYKGGRFRRIWPLPYSVDEFCAMDNSLPSNPIKWTVASLAVVVAFYVLREHWGHALGLLAYLFLLVCPLMHLFHGRGPHKNKDPE